MAGNQTRFVFAALFLLVCAAASANIPLPTILAFNINAVRGIGWFIASIVVVCIIEALVLKFAFKQEPIRALSLAARANLLSTAIGFLLFHPFEIIGLIVIFFLTVHFANTRLGLSQGKRVLLGLSVCVCIFVLMLPWGPIRILVIQMYVILLGMFFLTVLFESFVLAKAANTPRQGLRWSFAANGASYLLILVTLFMMDFRSGSLAMHEFHAFMGLQGATPGQRAKAIERLDEFYLWEQSGLKFTGQKKGETPIIELMRVQSWARAGDVNNARELLNTISRYHQRPSKEGVDYSFWRNAEDATSATVQHKR